MCIWCWNAYRLWFFLVHVLWSLRLIDDGYNNNVWVLVFVLINLLLIVCVFVVGLHIVYGSFALPI